MKRRTFLRLAGAASLNLLGGGTFPGANRRSGGSPVGSDPLTLFLCGDVMTGRGIDQILPRPVQPRLHEPWVKSALDYVVLAERTNGPIPRPAVPSYIWGDALEVLERISPRARIVNLETAVTAGGEPWPGKGIHYRMHPDNVSCLGAAGLPCCVLANNHVLDWGREGLRETLVTLRSAGMQTTGAGRDLDEAEAPAMLPVDGGSRVLVFGCAHESSGVPEGWAATATRAGVNVLADLSDRAVERVAERVRSLKRPGDIVVASIHWGGNWGYDVPTEQRRFAHALVERGAVDVVHGHSSHHPRGVEIWHDRPILYGCGDFVNDYEGIRGYEEYRGDLSLMYFVTLDRANGRLRSLEMVPMQIRQFRLHRAEPIDARWLAETLDRESGRYGCRVEPGAEGVLAARWQGRP